MGSFPILFSLSVFSDGNFKFFLFLRLSHLFTTHIIPANIYATVSTCAQNLSMTPCSVAMEPVWATPVSHVAPAAASWASLALPLLLQPFFTPQPARPSQVMMLLYPNPAVILHFICKTLRAYWTLRVYRIWLCTSSELSLSCWAPRRLQSKQLLFFLC